MKYGLILANRGVVYGLITTEELIQMAEIADQSDLFQSVWVGDSLLGKPRLESMVLLAAIAGRTKRVRIGPSCMASVTLRDPVLLAYQWASLDLIAQGRTILMGCTGIVEQEGGRREGELYGVSNRDRAERLEEWIVLLRRLWTEDSVTFEGKHYRCRDITVAPRPAAQPHPPLWIASNPVGSPERVKRALRRVVEYADGWQTTTFSPRMPELVATQREIFTELGRDYDAFETCLYHNINVNEDRETARQEAKQFLDEYYMTNFSWEMVDRWTATGSPEECVEQLRQYQAYGFKEVAIRCAGPDQFGQLKRVMEEVLPRLQ